jgi:hypothetical protein
LGVMPVHFLEHTNVVSADSNIAVQMARCGGILSEVEKWRLV